VQSSKCFSLKPVGTNGSNLLQFLITIIVKISIINSDLSLYFV
jgi:hypothetical protein